MFTRARWHLTLLYAALLGVTVVLVAGAIGVLAVREAHATDDRELQLRAGAVGAGVPDGPPPSPSGPGPGYRPRPDEHGSHLEEQGVLEYVMPVVDGQITPPRDQTLPGLPDNAGAVRALQSGSGQYTTIRVQGGAVRVYSLPVVRGGQTVGIVQVARSQYFVNAAVTRLALISLLAGLIGVALAAGAGYWLAGRTLRPIAVALDRQREFAGDASHELRTPLTVMLTNAELLTRHPERPLADYQDVVADIIAEIERLTRLVSDLLTLARADQGKAALAFGTVNLSEIGAAVVRQLQPAAAEKGVALEIEADPETAVWGDKDRLHQLVLILVDNAVRYTAAGAIRVRAQRQGHDGVLRVSDTGPGIAASHLPHLFERFYRTDDARSSEEGGTGLGLALAQWIAESHHGRIEVASSVGQGSTFTVHLPAARAHGRPRSIAAM
ncbi:MAG TPA: ATP-binding protein [Dehalococcoidia bacterium]|nr:ATP-binding protein [Dehalococcoidia bacterium]